MLAKLSIESEGACWSLRCDSATWKWERESRGNELLTASVVGPETAVKSLRALLVDPQASVSMTLDPPDENHYATNLVKTRRGKVAIGYLTKIAKLDRGAYHLVAVTKLGGVILDLSEDRLWDTLIGQAYTTPLLRGWVSAIMEQLKCQRLLEVSEGFNGQVGLLDLETETLDRIVSNLIAVGQLKLVA